MLLKNGGDQSGRKKDCEDIWQLRLSIHWNFEMRPLSDEEQTGRGFERLAIIPKEDHQPRPANNY
jgi:hypothetical protein